MGIIAGGGCAYWNAHHSDQTPLNYSLPQPLAITLVPLLLANLICHPQELASGKRLSVLLVLPCGGLFQWTSEIVQILEPSRDFVSPSYCKQCALLTITNIISITTHTNVFSVT